MLFGKKLEGVFALIESNDLVLLLKTVWMYWNGFRRLSLPIAWMEMDWKLKTLTKFFKFWCYVFQKSLRNSLWPTFSDKIHLISSSWPRTEAFCSWLKPQSLIILAQNSPKTAESSWHCSFNNLNKQLMPSPFRYCLPCIQGKTREKRFD